MQILYSRRNEPTGIDKPVTTYALVKTYLVRSTEFLKILYIPRAYYFSFLEIEIEAEHYFVATGSIFI